MWSRYPPFHPTFPVIGMEKRVWLSAQRASKKLYIDEPGVVEHRIAGGTTYRLCVWYFGYPLVVLRHSGCDCGRGLEDLAMERRPPGWVCVLGVG